MNEIKLLKLLTESSSVEPKRVRECGKSSINRKRTQSGKARERLAQKAALSNCAEVYPCLAGAYVIDDTQQISNGHAAGIYKDILEGLVTPPEGVQLYDIRKVFDQYNQKVVLDIMIDLAELKQLSKIAIEKGQVYIPSL